ncbi:MAG: biotin/lipoyl-containing protein [Acetivibrionales bacterium]|jgi:biotin carboxyl carrier protein
MKYIVTINDKNYEVEVEKGQATILITSQAAAPVIQTQPVPAAPVAAPAPAAAASSPGGISGEAIKAPMPGTILSIKVSPGTSVKKGDTLVILEAMKMENEISAPRDGVVSEVIVTTGASVSTGDVLLAIK